MMPHAQQLIKKERQTSEPTRLSKEGPSEEKLATEPLGLVVDAPTDSTFFPVEGAITF